MNYEKRSTERKQEPNDFPVLKVGRKATIEEELEAAQILHMSAVRVLKETAYNLKNCSQYLSKMAENIEQSLLEIS